MSLEAFSTISPGATHFEIESEVLVGFLRAQQPVDFVPISVIYNSEKSKIRPLQDTVRWFCWLLSTQMPAKAKGPIGISNAEPSVVEV